MSQNPARIAPRSLFSLFPASSVAGLLALGLAAHAQTPSPESSQPADPLNTVAPYAYILDADSDVELYCKACREPMIPASMSKLMVYYIVFERIRDGRLSLDDEFTVSEHAWRTGGAGTDGSTMFLTLNSKVRVEDLLRGAIIQSGNDACIVLAEGISGSEAAFAEEMTRRAKDLGLENSTFANASGLDNPDQRMSAADIGKLGAMLVRDFPQFYPMFSEPEFTWNGIRQYNRNPLLREMPGADGIKTGHLSASGYGLVGTVARDEGRRVVVLQGLKSETERRQEGARVMRAAFSDFKSVELVAAGSEVATADVWLGDQKTVPLVVAEAIDVGLHVDSVKSLNAIVQYKGPLIAPVSEGDVVGEIVFTATGMAETRIPVLAGASVKKRGLFGRALYGMRGD